MRPITVRLEPKTERRPHLLKIEYNSRFCFSHTCFKQLYRTRSNYNLIFSVINKLSIATADPATLFVFLVPGFQSAWCHWLAVSAADQWGSGEKGHVTDDLKFYLYLSYSDLWNKFCWLKLNTHIYIAYFLRIFYFICVFSILLLITLLLFCCLSYVTTLIKTKQQTPCNNQH